MILVIIQFVANLLLCIFLRTCTAAKTEKGLKKMPRIIFLVALLLSAVPVLGCVIFLILTITAVINIYDYIYGDSHDGSHTIVENRFTKFWFK
jgi:hypothetical protein